MKKIIVFFITLFISITTVFADNTVDISVSDNDINIGDNLQLQINIGSDSNESIEIVDINGIEEFNQVSQNQSRQVQIINGESSSVYTLQLGLVPTNTGSFVLGPVSVQFGDEIIYSDPIEISVKSENIPRIQENNTKKDTLDNTVLEEDNQEIIDSSSDNGNINSDIHTVKKIDLELDDFQYTYTIYFLLFIIFLIIFYNFLLKILENKKSKQFQKQQEIEKIDLAKKEIDSIYGELLQLSDSASDFSQVEFYEQLNNLFRRYFTHIGVYNADKRTLAELKNDTIDSKIFDIFSTSYMYEFSTQEDTLSTRKQIIMNFMLYLKK